MINNGIPLSAAYNKGVTYQQIVHHIDKAQSNGIIPRLGSIILYNEVIKYHGRKLAKPYRGCGVVATITDTIILLDVPIKPGIFIKTSLLKSDFILGLIEYVQLKDFVYKTDYSYDQLSIRKLDSQVKKLVVSS